MAIRNILRTFGIFYGHLVHLGYFMNIWYTFGSFGTFFPDLVSCAMKNLATLEQATFKPRFAA
jgi:hypothetical protein